jgi:hypothetical protein
MYSFVLHLETHYWPHFGDMRRRERVLLQEYCCHFLFDENRVEVEEESEFGSQFQELTLGRKFHPYVDVQFGMNQPGIAYVYDGIYHHRQSGVSAPIELLESTCRT